jgi:hypothetical protein
MISQDKNQLVKIKKIKQVRSYFLELVLDGKKAEYPKEILRVSLKS